MSYTIEETDLFKKWYNKQTNHIQAVITRRIMKIANNGEFGHVKTNLKVDGKVVRNLSSLKFTSGLRIYFTRTGKTIILLLNGGTKNAQDKDIRKAARLLD